MTSAFILRDMSRPATSPFAKSATPTDRGTGTSKSKSRNNPFLLPVCPVLKVLKPAWDLTMLLRSHHLTGVHACLPSSVKGSLRSSQLRTRNRVQNLCALPRLSLLICMHTGKSTGRDSYKSSPIVYFWDVLSNANNFCKKKKMRNQILHEKLKY